jgi:hypothetical protein
VRVPRLSGRQDVVITLRREESPGTPPDPQAVWDAHYRLVIHDTADPSDVTAHAHRVATEPTGAVGRRSWVVSHADSLNLSEALTVEAWVEDHEGRAEAMQALVSKWTPRSSFEAFDAYDAGRTDGLDTTGFFGAVFDGRYVTFVPQHDLEDRHGKVLRYDTHGDFHDPKSWAGYDASHTEGLVTKGYYGAVSTGRYLFFCPRRDPEGFHSRVLRFDPRGDFRDPRSWQAYDMGLTKSCQSAAFDGRYIYFSPGQEARPRTSAETVPAGGPPAVTGMSADLVLSASGLIVRHDTHGEFADPRRWTTYDASGTSGLETRDFDGALFDGRFIYFMPLSYAAVLRYDTRGEFQDAGSWAAYDARKLGMKRLVGGVFDGRYVYCVPYGDCPVAVRYDTAGEFRDDASWEAFELRRAPGLDALGYDGAFFDGRYIYYIPYWDEGTNFHGVVLRYDTQGAFTDPGSWECRDSGLTAGLKTVGFNGGATDGRYLYFAAWRDETNFPERIVGNGRVLRYDTTGRQGAFSLRYCDLGHNGGLCAALPGARFLVNTDRGPISVAANRRPEPGRHHLAGVYDGRMIRLYLDGELVNEQPASGAIINNEEDVAIGRILHGLGQFNGPIEEVRISAASRSADWLRTQYHNLSDPGGSCRLQAETDSAR